ncbi:hypothetical protein L1S32_00065 [Methanogenium sp. S4BF]|uniref:hypothetical protein n=1 Tax=Methanogenium sp. S4BF TaxID=1789226 RepID=UPI002416863C|nr:hypothetical protein [Methanogenium sp. S4BF]WFN34552.1 hypothetical protein L1S32_00065 [Methanogenium sp. S4BF]
MIVSCRVGTDFSGISKSSSLVCIRDQDESARTAKLRQSILSQAFPGGAAGADEAEGLPAHP